MTKGEYGLASFDLADGPQYAPQLKEATKPSAIDDFGTRVTLLGNSPAHNTCLPPEDAGETSMNWLLRYLNTRYFRVSENVKIQVRVLTKDAGAWPGAEPVSSEKTYNLETVRGAKAVFDGHSSARGTVHLTDADVHWWLFEDAAVASKNMSSRGLRTSMAGVVFQNELYILRRPPAARKILAGFGVLFGSDHVAICVEPRESLDVRADTARSRLIVNGEDEEEADWWSTWGLEFRERMPEELRELMDRIIAKTENDPEGKVRERILERLKRIRELLRPTRYRRSLAGPLKATGEAIGGTPSSADRDEAEEPRRSASGRGGRASDMYLAELVEEGGEPAEATKPTPREPELMWVSKAEGTREEDENEDRAAWFPSDPVSDAKIKVNKDFRGYRDLVAYFSREIGAEGDPALERKVVELVQEWMAGQLIEAVMATRALQNGGTWAAVTYGRHSLRKHLQLFLWQGSSLWKRCVGPWVMR